MYFCIFYFFVDKYEQFICHRIFVLELVRHCGLNEAFCQEKKFPYDKQTTECSGASMVPSWHNWA